MHEVNHKKLDEFTDVRQQEKRIDRLIYCRAALFVQGIITNAENARIQNRLNAAKENMEKMIREENIK